MLCIQLKMEHIFFLLIGKSNLDKIKTCETALGRFGLGRSIRKRKHNESRASTANLPFVLSADERKLADVRSKSIVMSRNSFDPGTLFIRTTSMKSHDWKEVDVHVPQCMLW